MFSAPRYRGPVSEHFDGRRFHNPSPTGKPRGLTDLIRWVATRHRGPWRSWTDAPPGPPPPSRVQDLRVTFVNHATVLIQAAGLNFLTDPVWSDRVSPVSFAGPKRVRPPGIRFEDLPPIDLVLLSHNHYDHLDVPTLARLTRRDGPRILAGLGVPELLARRAIGNAMALDWWERSEIAQGVSVTAVPVQHFSGRGMTDRNATLWTGFVISSAAGPVFFAGDTGYGPHFSEIGKRFPGIRLAVLPIGAYRPEWFMGPVHETPAQAFDAMRDLGASTAVGMHFGTFALTDEGEEEPPAEIARLLAAAPEEKPRFWVLGFGEGRDVP
jgi:L-ascorbate metabolism protein UlaG (beta-lactamase superfamily)